MLEVQIEARTLDRGDGTGRSMKRHGESGVDGELAQVVLGGTNLVLTSAALVGFKLLYFWSSG